MERYVCLICGYVYDPEEGDPDFGIEPGTPFLSCQKTGFVLFVEQVKINLKKSDFYLLPSTNSAPTISPTISSGLVSLVRRSPTFSPRRKTTRRCAT